MSYTLIIYSTTDGQTKKICEALTSQLTDAGKEVRLSPLAQQSQIDWEQVEQVYLGASIRYGNFNKRLLPKSNLSWQRGRTDFAVLI